MRITLLVLVLLALPAGATVASAGPTCEEQPPLGGTYSYLDPNGDCLGVVAGLGFEFRCTRSVGAVQLGPVWVSVLSTFGCQTGVVVTLP